MTHKFKFGDKVRHQYDTELTGVVIVPVTISGITIVWFDGDQSCSDFNAEDLEPIPHSDTVRLNWLENETKMVGDSVHFGHDGVHFFCCWGRMRPRKFCEFARSHRFSD